MEGGGVRKSAAEFEQEIKKPVADRLECLTEGSLRLFDEKGLPRRSLYAAGGLVGTDLRHQLTGEIERSDGP